jgi:hypothetical protein
MRKLVLSAALCLMSWTACAADAPVPAVAPHVHDLAPLFVTFWDANKDKPAAEQLAAFKRDVASAYPAFYGIERYNGEKTQAERDAEILKAIQTFPAIRDAYIKTAGEFETSLPRYLASFKAAFSDFQLQDEVYVLHSLGEMDGGTRGFGGKLVLIFGIDGMVRYHAPGSDPAPFFHHELFHVYHHASMAACSGQEVWSQLWGEGLAVYVAKTLDPAANDDELELDFPVGSAKTMRETAVAGMAQLETVLDSTERAPFDALFSSRGADDGTGLPRRRGYYLGYLVAQEAGTTRSLQQLAKLDCAQAHALIRETVHKLNAARVR